MPGTFGTKRGMVVVYLRVTGRAKRVFVRGRGVGLAQHAIARKDKINDGIEKLFKHSWHSTIVRKAWEG